MRIRSNEISHSRLERYITEKINHALKKILNKDFEGSYMMWGLDIASIYNKGIEEVKQKGINDPIGLKLFAIDYTVGFCMGVLQVKVDMYSGEFGRELIEKIDILDMLDVSAMELNEMLLCVSKIDSMDVLTNCAGVVRDMELVEFGVIKAYVGLIQDDLLSKEVVAKRIGMTVEQVERIIEKGVEYKDKE